MENTIKQMKDYIQELKDERDEYKKDYQRLLKTAEKIAKENKQLKSANKPISAEKWHVDDGNVIWWKLPINEPPYVGTPLDCEFTPNYYSHFTRLIEPSEFN